MLSSVLPAAGNNSSLRESSSSTAASVPDYYPYPDSPQYFHRVLRDKDEGTDNNNNNNNNNNKVANSILEDLNVTDLTKKGIVYVLKFEGIKYVKIGYTTRRKFERPAEIGYKCGFKLHRMYQHKPFNGAFRAEKIVHSLLEASKWTYHNCPCGGGLINGHQEWFKEPFVDAVMRVQLVCNWMMFRNPYNLGLKEPAAMLDPGWRKLLRAWILTQESKTPDHWHEFFLRHKSSGSPVLISPKKTKQGREIMDGLFDVDCPARDPTPRTTGQFKKPSSHAPNQNIPTPTKHHGKERAIMSADTKIKGRDTWQNEDDDEQESWINTDHDSINSHHGSESTTSSKPSSPNKVYPKKFSLAEHMNKESQQIDRTTSKHPIKVAAKHIRHLRDARAVSSKTQSRRGRRTRSSHTYDDDRNDSEDDNTDENEHREDHERRVYFRKLGQEYRDRSTNHDHDNDITTTTTKHRRRERHSTQPADTTIMPPSRRPTFLDRAAPSEKFNMIRRRTGDSLAEGISSIQSRAARVRDVVGGVVETAKSRIKSVPHRHRDQGKEEDR